MSYGVLDHLVDAGHVGSFAGTWLEIVGLVTAIIAGTIATLHNYRTPTSVTSR